MTKTYNHSEFDFLAMVIHYYHVTYMCYIFKVFIFKKGKEMKVRSIDDPKISKKKKPVSMDELTGEAKKKPSKRRVISPYTYHEPTLIKLVSKDSIAFPKSKSKYLRIPKPYYNSLVKGKDRPLYLIPADLGGVITGLIGTDKEVLFDMKKWLTSEEFNTVAIIGERLIEQNDFKDMYMEYIDTNPPIPEGQETFVNYIKKKAAMEKKENNPIATNQYQCVEDDEDDYNFSDADHFYSGKPVEGYMTGENVDDDEDDTLVPESNYGTENIKEEENGNEECSEGNTGIRSSVCGVGSDCVYCDDDDQEPGRGRRVSPIQEYSAILGFIDDQKDYKNLIDYPIAEIELYTTDSDALYFMYRDSIFITSEYIAPYDKRGSWWDAIKSGICISGEYAGMKLYTIWSKLEGNPHALTEWKNGRIKIKLLKVN